MSLPLTTATSTGLRLRVPKLRAQSFETAIIERDRRRESAVEEVLVEMYLAGVSVRRVEDITEAPWGTRVSPSTVSDLNKKIYATIEAWRNRPIEGDLAALLEATTITRLAHNSVIRGSMIRFSLPPPQNGTFFDKYSTMRKANHVQRYHVQR